MPEFLVEVDTTGREVYAITATDEADAKARAVEDGDCVVQETMSVEGIRSVREVTE
jgi:hypothetical protein